MATTKRKNTKRKTYKSTVQAGFGKRAWSQYYQLAVLGSVVAAVAICYGLYLIASYLIYLALLMLAIAAILATMYLSVKAGAMINDQRLKWRTADANGNYPLQSVKAQSGFSGFVGNFLGSNFSTLVDVTKRVDGVVSPFMDQVAIDSAQQLMYATKQQKMATIKSLANNGTRAAVIRTAAQSLDRTQLKAPKFLSDSVVEIGQADVIEPVAQPVELIDAKRAFKLSTADKWIVGQDRQTGDVCEINVRDLTYFGVLGEKGTGKTARIGNLLLAYAIRYGWHCMTLDGKGGSDLQKFDKYAEFLALDYTNVGSVVDVLTTERVRRQAILNQYGVNNIFLLPDNARIQPVFVLCDEFGAVMDTLKAYDKAEYKKVDTELGNLFRLGRSTGIAMAVCDQNPSKWSNTMRANFSTNVLFKIGGGVGAAVQAYNLHKLKKDGGFEFDGQVYHAFNTWECIDELLPRSYRKPLPLLNRNNVVSDRTNHTSTKAVGISNQSDTPRKDRTGMAGTSGTTGTAEVVTESTRVVTVTSPLSGPIVNRRELLMFQRAVDEFKTQNSVIKHLWGVEIVTPKHRKWYKTAEQKLAA